MIDKSKAIKIIDLLSKEYPKGKTALNYKTPFQLLVATILSAQCTDNKVNEITPHIFSKYKDVYGFSKAKKEKLERDIYSTGFYKSKAKNIIESSKILVKEFNGVVPDSMDKLIKLPGVARKTANIILSSIFKKTEGIAVDTHVKRLSNRLNFSNNKNPDKIERDLMEIFPKRYWLRFNYVLVSHGRKVCKAKNPTCYKCVVNRFCNFKDKII